MAYQHTKRDEDAGWWRAQIEASQRVWNRVRTKHYRQQLKRVLDLSVDSMIVSPPISTDDVSGMPYVEQIDVLYLPRFMAWVRSQAFDDNPEIRYPRFSSPDTEYGSWVEELLLRTGHECREMDQWSMAVQDAGCNGSFAVWYGIHTTGSSAGDIQDVMRGIDEVASMAEQGISNPHPDQDHRALSKHMRDEASKPEVALGVQGEFVQKALHAAAQAHDKLGDKKEDGPYPNKREEAKVWCKRSPIGSGTLWDGNANDIEDARFMARKVVMDIDDARNCKAFKPSARQKIDEAMFRMGDGYEGEEFSIHEPGTIVHDDDKLVRSHKAVIWEIWDRKYEERHYITNGVDEFLEVDSAYPYYGEDGRPIFRSFWPAVVYAPIKKNADDNERPYGIPFMSPGWPLQQLAIKLLSHNLDAVKKLTVRLIEIDEDADEDLEGRLTSGQMGLVYRAPYKPDRNGPAVRPVNFGSVPNEIFQQFVTAQHELAKVLGWPLSQMTGAPQADTATAEVVSVRAGQEQRADLVRHMELAYAEGQEIKRQLLREFYSSDKVVELLGPEYGEKWEEWRIAPTAGDRLEVRFASRVQSEDPVRIKQIREALILAREATVPGTLIPKYETDYLVEEYFRLLGLGKPVMHEPSEFEFQMAAQQAMGAAGMQAPDAGAAPDQGGRPEEKPATGQQMNAAAQNVGPNTNGSGGQIPS